MSIAGKLLEDLKNIVNPQVMDSMEDETGLNEVEETKALTEDYEEDDELGLYIQTDGYLYHKYLEKNIEKGTPIAWDRLVAEAAKRYIREISKNDPDAPQKFSAEELQSAKEYIQDYYASELTPEQREATGRNYQALTVKPKNTNEDFKPAKMKKAEYKDMKIKKPEEEKASIKEEVAEKLSFKIGDADCTATNSTSDDITAEDVKQAIETKNPPIFFNDADSYHYIMDFSFDKNGKKYWIESKNIEGDFSKMDFNIYESAPVKKSVAGKLLKQCEDLKIEIEVKDDGEIEVEIKPEDAEIVDVETEEDGDAIEEEPVADTIEPAAVSNEPDFDEDFKPAKMEKAKYNKTQAVKPQEDENGKKAEKELKEAVELKPSVEYDEREGKYVCFATENGGGIKYTDTQEEAIQFLIDKYGVKKEDIQLQESRADKIRKGAYKRVKHESLNEDKYSDVEALIEEIFGKVGTEPGDFRLYSDIATAFVTKNRQGGGITGAIVRGKNLKELTLKLEAIKDYIAYQKHPEYFNEAWSDAELAQVGALDKLTKKYKIYQNKGGEIVVTAKSLNDKWSLMGEEDDFDDAQVFVDDNFRGLCSAIGYDKDLLNDDEAKTYEPLNSVKFDDDSDNYMWDISNDYADKNESMNEVKPEDVEEVKVQRQLNSLKAALKANATGEEEDIKKAVDAADKADKNIKLTKKWKKAKGLTESVSKIKVAYGTFNGEKGNSTVYKQKVTANLTKSELKELNEFIKVEGDKNSYDKMWNKPLKEGTNYATLTQTKLFKQFFEVKRITDNNTIIVINTIKDKITEAQTVIASYDNGKHEIVKCDKGYFNKYNITEGKARFTTKCVKNLPTAIGALKKRFPEAEEDKR